MRINILSLPKLLIVDGIRDGVKKVQKMVENRIGASPCTNYNTTKITRSKSLKGNSIHKLINIYINHSRRSPSFRWLTTPLSIQTLLAYQAIPIITTRIRVKRCGSVILYRRYKNATAQ